MKVGLQVYTVRNHLKENPRRTLEQVVEAGYKDIEFANHQAEKDVGIGFGYSKEEMKAIIRDLGINVIGAHVMPSDRDDVMWFYEDLEYFKKFIDYFLDLGAKYLSIPHITFDSKDQLLRRCESLNKLAKLGADNGISILFHNHWNEFQQFDGENILDIMMANTDPVNFKLELDTYWTILGLVNPCDLMHKYKERVAILHQKDFPLSQMSRFNAWDRVPRDRIVSLGEFRDLIDPELFIEPGNGVLKIQDFIDVGNEYHIPYILVEQDYSKYDEIESINISMRNFKKMRGLEWD